MVRWFSGDWMFQGFQWFGSVGLLKDVRMSIFRWFGFGWLIIGFGFRWSFSEDRIVLLLFADTKMEKIGAGMKLFRLRGGFARRKCDLPDESK